MTQVGRGPALRRSARRVAPFAATILLATTACGTSAPQRGTLDGTVFGSGGPPTLPPRNLNHLRLQKVIVTASGAHSAMFRTVTSKDGTFSLNVPPGIYLLSAQCGTASPADVRVRSGARVKRNIYCEFG
jgi:hypothetical protein